MNRSGSNVGLSRHQQSPIAIAIATMSRRRGAKPKPKAKPVAKAPSSKERTQFLEALKLYEGKQFKKSNRTLDTLLKKNHKNPETLALKGLNLENIGDKEDAAYHIKQATDLISGTETTAICCHVLGIYMKTVKRYKDSIKWFQASLDNGSTNTQIYRDLASLDSQVGDFKNALIARKKYWESFLGYRANWTALAVAQDINGESQQAVNTLSQFEKLAEGKISDAEAFEHSECLIYKNDIMYRAAGVNKDKLEKVLRHLDTIEPKVFDKFGIWERRAAIHMKMGQFKDASIVYRTLIKRNPDNFNYYKLLEVSLGVTNNNKLRKILYEKLGKFYPRAEPPKFIPLTFIKDEDELKKKLTEYVIPQLKRGVPATFSNVKPLYQRRGQSVTPLLLKIVTDYLASIDSKENASQYIWTCYYLAQHYLFVKDFSKAQEYIDLAITHTPTMVEFYIMKGRILKHTGQLVEAANIVEEGRQLDTQDRFINCKTVKYFLRANNIDKAVEVVSLFTKNDDSVNGVKDLHSVEASWFIVEQAEAYYRLYVEAMKKLTELKKELKETDGADTTANANSEDDGDGSSKELSDKVKDAEWDCIKFKGLALKRFIAIAKFYKQFEDDKLDFHSYCMRKGTPRAYLDLLSWGKAIYTKPMFVRSMEGAARIYFGIHDAEMHRRRQHEEHAGQDVEEKVKISNKKLKKEAAALHKRREEQKKTVLAYAESQDDDVFGEELINTKSALADFNTHFYEKYSEQIRDDERISMLDFEYHYRTGKLALCLSSLTKTRNQYGADCALLGAMLIFLLSATRESSSCDEIAKKVIMKALESDYSEKVAIGSRDDPAFDWLEYLKEHYRVAKDLTAMLFIYRNDAEGIFDQGKIKPLIIDAISGLDPCQQNRVLEYEL